MKGEDKLSIFLDKLFAHSTKFIAITILFIVAWIFTVLVNHSMEAIHAFGFDFLTTDVWAPNLEKFGALPAIYGSVVSTFLAMILAIPLAFLSSIIRISAFRESAITIASLSPAPRLSCFCSNLTANSFSTFVTFISLPHSSKGLA